jgi:transposase
MHASLKALRQRERPADCLNNQLALFNHSVLEHDVADSSALSVKRSEKSRCMMENINPRPTYSQEWTAYNQAQTNEKAQFLSLLYSLCQNIEDLPRKGVAGRNRLPLSEMIFCAVFKVFSLVSGRRFISDLQEANRRGYISKTPHFNSIFNYLELEEMTDILKQMIVTSSLPLKSVEHDFAVDSSGFSTGLYRKWVDTKWGKPEFPGKQKACVKLQDWVKVHLMCGVRTNIVTSIEITHARAGDSPQFESLVETTSQNFEMREVSADKAYTSQKNLYLVVSKGAQPYIPFRKNTNVNQLYGDRQTPFWKKMFHQYMANQDEFMRHYHKRSNVECTFSMIKRKFGERLRSKTRTAQENETLCKVLCHNLCCVIQSVYELGIEPTFWNDASD